MLEVGKRSSTETILRGWQVELSVNAGIELNVQDAAFALLYRIDS